MQKDPFMKVKRIKMTATAGWSGRGASRSRRTGAQVLVRVAATCVREVRPLRNILQPTEVLRRLATDGGFHWSIHPFPAHVLGCINNDSCDGGLI